MRARVQQVAYAALLVHLSIGEIYAFGVSRNPLVERFGTGLTPIGTIFSISIVMLMLSAVVFARWKPHHRAQPPAAKRNAATCRGRTAQRRAAPPTAIRRKMGSNSMSKSEPRGSQSSVVLALVLLPLLWGIYQTLTAW